ASRYVVINLARIITADRDRVAKQIPQSRKEIVAVDYEQMEHFPGNILQVPAKNGQMHLIMSTQAWHSLSPAPQQRLQSYKPVIHSDLSIIEQNGGGSARCMMAEIFLKPKKK